MIWVVGKGRGRPDGAGGMVGDWMGALGGQGRRPGMAGDWVSGVMGQGVVSDWVV